MTKQLKVFFQHEQDDLELLTICFLIISIVWYIFIGIRNDQAIMAGDSLLYFARIVDLFEQGGDWKNLIYRSDILGGVYVADISGKLLFYKIFYFFGLSPLNAMNFAVLSTQVFFSYLASRATIDIRNILIDGLTKTSKTDKFILATLFAFLPMYAGRLVFGHLDLLLGLVVFVGIMAIILAWRAKTISMTLLFMILISLIHALPSHGHQTKFYSVFFGLPIFISLLFIGENQWPGFKEWIKRHQFTFWVAVCTFISAFMVSLPEFIGILEYASHSDAARISENMTYQFNTATLKSLLISIPWEKQLFDVDLEGMPHEMYSIGPMFILLFALLFTKLRMVGIGLIICFILSLILSMNIKPLSDILLYLVPPLQIFRVPARSLMVFNLGLTISCASLFLYLSHKKIQVNHLWLTVILSVLILPFLSPGVRELLIWLALIIGLALIRFKKIKYEKFLMPLLIVLTVASVCAFKNWFHGFYSDLNTKYSQLKKAGNILEEKYKRMFEPFTRVQVGFEDPRFDVHTGIPMGASMLSGYWFPPKRFLDLLIGIDGMRYKYYSIYIKINQNRKEFPILQQLYNVCCEIKLDENKKAIISQLTPTSGPAWFSDNIIVTEDISEIILKLKSAGTQLNNYLKKNILINKEDPIVKNLPKELKISSGCSSSKVLEIKQGSNKQSYDLKVNSTGDCILTIATNYIERFNATGYDDKGNAIQLATIPVYGPLLGIVVNKEIKNINVSAKAYAPVWTYVLRFFGIFMFIGIFVVAQNWKRTKEK